MIYCTARGERSGSEAVYALLDHAYRSEFGGVMPEIKKTSSGKPYFPVFPYIHFSLSHSKTHVLCALSKDPVGADIESPRKISRRTIDYFSKPEELLLFDPLDLWVLKESYIKLLGGTLPQIKKIRFSRESKNGKIIAPDISVKARLYHVGDCRAAVCMLGDEPPDSIEMI